MLPTYYTIGRRVVLIVTLCSTSLAPAPPSLFVSFSLPSFSGRNPTLFASTQHEPHKSGQLSVEAIGEELSPIAPGPLDGFRNGKARFPGFDKQAGFKSPGTNGVSPRDDLWEDSGEEGEEEEEKEEVFAAQGRDRRMLGWERFPGETSITSAVRMYFANLDPDASHKENCGVVLHQVRH